MSDSIAEMSQSMMNGIVLDNGNGWICKFDPDCLSTSDSDYSPFVCCEFDSDWEPITDLWGQFYDMTEAVKLRFDLEVDTKVFVKQSADKAWNPNYFKCFKGYSSMECFKGGQTSFSLRDKYDDDNSRTWRYWKIGEGKFEGETNLIVKKQGE